MPLTSKQAIFAVHDLEIVEFPVEEWGDSVLLRPWDAFELEKFRKLIASTQRDGESFNITSVSNLFPKLVASSIVDEDGALVFEEEDIEALSKKSGTAIDKIGLKVLGLNGMGPDDVDEMEGNSEGTPSEDSG